MSALSIESTGLNALRTANTVGTAFGFHNSPLYQADKSKFIYKFQMNLPLMKARPVRAAEIREKNFQTMSLCRTVEGNFAENHYSSNGCVTTVSPDLHTLTYLLHGAESFLRS